MKNKIAVIGLGYVGLPLAYAFSKKYEVEYKLRLAKEVKINDYDAVVLAVVQDEYKSMRLENKKQVIFNIKSMLNNSDGKL